MLAPVFGTLTGRQVLAHRVSRQDNLLLGEETLHPLVGDTDLRSVIAQQFVRHSGETVLLLKDDRHSHPRSHFHGRTGGIAPHPDTYIRAEITDNLTGLQHRTHQVKHYREVLPWLRTVKPAHGKTDNVVPRLGYTFHLHPSKSSHKQNIGILV